MSKLLVKVRTTYRNLRIRNKIFVVLLFIVLLFFTVIIITTKLTFNIYSTVLYDQAYDTLDLATTNIEHELQNIDNISYEIISDTNVQNYVNVIKTSVDSQGVIDNRTLLVGQMTSYTMSQHYISSANYIDTRGIQSTTGLMDTEIEQKYADEIYQKATDANGSSIFVGPRGDDLNTVYITRAIRAVPNLRLDDMGVLVLRCNIAKIVGNYLNVIRNNASVLTVFDGDNLVYRSSKIPISDLKIAGHSEKSTYVIKTIDGMKYYIVVNKSAYTGWEYIYMVPYEALFQKIIFIQMIEYCIFAVVLVIVIFLGMRFAISLTKPLEMLTDEIKLVETGNFDLPGDRISNEVRMDEIGVLQHDFDLMIQKIDELIRENYVKQLVIKDTQVKALQAQINPHFLYNTLESINWMAKVNQQNDISRMAESLGNLLRGALKIKEKTITIGEELQLLQNYITIQKIRYEERLDFQLYIEEDLKQYRIPQLTLQPIVENAIAYGLESMDGICTIRVSFLPDDDKINIMIEDNGPGIAPETLAQINEGTFKPHGFGIGIKNISDRLKLVFGDECRIQVLSEPGEFTKVLIRIPMEE